MAGSALTIWDAIAAGAGALVLKYISDFVATDYKRWRDGAAVAAAIAGELSSYLPAYQLLADTVTAMKGFAEQDKKEALAFRPFEPPKDRVFDAYVSSLGVLGSQATEGIVYVYGNIAAFRLSFALIMNHGKDMTTKEIGTRCLACLLALGRAKDTGVPLVADLRARADQGFWHWWLRRDSRRKS